MKKISIEEKEESVYIISCKIFAGYDNTHIPYSVARQILSKDLIRTVKNAEFKFKEGGVKVSWMSDDSSYEYNALIAEQLQDEVSSICYSYKMFTIFSAVE